MSLHFEASEHAMHVAARADSFHDLLPDVAALGEIQRVLLSGLLRQIAFAKINSKARYPSDDAIEFKGIAAGRHGAGQDQGVPDCIHVLRGKPDLESIHLRLRAAREGNPNSAPHSVDHLPEFELRDVQTGSRQNFARLRTCHANRGELVADVGNLDVVHDDVAIEDLSYRRLLLAVGGDQQVVAAVVGDQVSLDAPLGVKDEAVHTAPRRKVADVVRDHAIQPAYAVLSGQHQLGLPAHVEESATLQQRSKFSRGIAEVRGSFRAPMNAEARAVGRKLLLKGSNTHTEYLIIRSGVRIVGRGKQSALSTQHSAFSQRRLGGLADGWWLTTDG